MLTAKRKVQFFSVFIGLIAAALAFSYLYTHERESIAYKESDDRRIIFKTQFLTTKMGNNSYYLNIISVDDHEYLSTVSGGFIHLNSCPKCQVKP